MELPSTGGRWTRDPDTGALTLVAEAAAPAPSETTDPVAPASTDADPATEAPAEGDDASADQTRETKGRAK